MAWDYLKGALFIGPFRSKSEFRNHFLPRMLAANPGFEWRNAAEEVGNWDPWLSCGFSAGEHCGVLSWGGEGFYRDQVRMTPEEFLCMLSPNTYELDPLPEGMFETRLPQGSYTEEEEDDDN